MIGHYLPNNNENATVALCQKFWHPNKPQSEGHDATRSLFFSLKKALSKARNFLDAWHAALPYEGNF